MNYEPNLKIWRKGDIVIHDADAKTPHMFMRVIGYTRDGLCKTQYVNRVFSRKVYINELKYLLHPDCFDLHWQDDPEAWERVRRWNHYHPVGTRVLLKHADGTETVETTRSKAWLGGHVHPYVSLEGRAGGYPLDILNAHPDGVREAGA